VLFGVQVAAQTPSLLESSTITANTLSEVAPPTPSLLESSTITSDTLSKVAAQTPSLLSASTMATLSEVSSLASTSPASGFSTTTGSATPTIPASASPSATYFYTNWTLSENPVPLNQMVKYTYEYYSNVPPTGSLTLYLCQSNTSTTPNSDNTWLVLLVPWLTKSKFTTNKNT
jgi:hypothetical protein